MLASIAVLSITTILPAQEAGFSGVGPINLSMAGAATALPLDSAGALTWNPATIGALEKTEFNCGLTRSNAPWFGDEFFVGAVLFPIWLTLELADDDLDLFDDDWDRPDQPGPKPGFPFDDDPEETEGTQEEEEEAVAHEPGRRGVVRTFNVSYVYKLKNEKYAWGIGISENGAHKNRLVPYAASGNGKIIYVVEHYRVKGYEILPTFSVRPRENLYLGLSPVLTIDEFPTGSLPLEPGTETVHRSRSRFGFGVQLGAFYRTDNHWNFGFSARSPQWIQGARLEWINPADGETQRRRFSCAQDWPMRLVLGIAYTGCEQFHVAFDVRYYDFSHSRSLYGIAGRKSRTENLTSYALGVQWKTTPDGFLSFRMGYQFNDGTSDYEDYLYNTTVPIQRGHSIHYGLTLGGSEEAFNLSVAFAHAFGDGKVDFPTEEGPVSFDANPNNSTFSIGFRIKR